ncbi:NAD-dependent epimerase/dehydratase family protein [Polyangium aurulentum]|uniref:NAD-dependent epimerase/dehydratase family protein n=1 Tax=Polyangium aurulentum TaxID=2567896 RepID=UPI0010AE7336|nr:NAD(P)-dependent oxidoreductase [Polyangium aurulentum]UQA62406.1 NAD(P)-dependent oxidoreductase [Polyangium aurulentum]
MRVLVTGATGFLGSHIAEMLGQEGHSVVALARRTSNTKFLSSLRGVEIAYGAVEDAKSVRAAMKGVDAVIHAAGLVKARNEQEFFTINADGTTVLLDAAKEIPDLKRFVFVSSLAAVGPSDDGKPVPSTCSPRPVTHYGRSKLEGERRVLAEKDKLPVVVLRPPMIYGPRDQESFAFFQSVSRRVLPYLGDGKNTMSVIYATDAASACINALDREAAVGNTYFIDDGEVYVWKDMLAEIERALARPAFLRMGVPFSVFKAAALASELGGRLTGKAVMLTRDKVKELSAPHWVCDSSDTRRDLGWAPKVQWPEGVRRSVEWYRANGWLS